MLFSLEYISVLKVLSNFTRYCQMHNEDLMQKLPSWSSLPRLSRKTDVTFLMTPQYLTHMSSLAFTLAFN